MAFDIQGARQAGYSDADIADYLGQKAGFNVDAARKAGYQDSDILAELSSAWAKQELPKGVKPSDAGAGRGSIIPDAPPAPQPKKGPSLADAAQGPGAVLANIRSNVRQQDVIGRGGRQAERDGVTADPLSKPIQSEPTPADLDAWQTSPERVMQAAKQKAYSAGATAPSMSQTSASNLAGQSLRKAVGDNAADTLLLAPEMMATTAKLGADIANLATLGVAQPVSDWLGQTVQAIGAAKSPRFKEKQAEFSKLMSDPNAGVLDVAAFMASNPRFTVEIGAPSVPSMLLGAGGARIGAHLLAKRGAAETGATLGAGAANVLMNAGDSFSSAQGDLTDRLTAAAGAGVGTALLGKLDGAEKALATGRGGVLRTMRNEGLQEAGESLSQSLGQGAASGQFDPNQAFKQAATEGVIGGLIGGAAGGASSLVEPVRPTEARANVFKRLDDLASLQGISPKVVAGIKKAAESRPMEDLSGWVKRAIGKLQSDGLVRPMDEATLSMLDDAPASPAQPVAAVPTVGAEEDYTGLDSPAIAPAISPDVAPVDATAEQPAAAVQPAIESEPTGATGTGRVDASEPGRVGSSDAGIAAGAASVVRAEPEVPGSGVAAEPASGAAASGGAVEVGAEPERAALTPTVGQKYKLDGNTYEVTASDDKKIVVQSKDGRKRTIARGSAGWKKIEGVLAKAKPVANTNQAVAAPVQGDPAISVQGAEGGSSDAQAPGRPAGERANGSDQAVRSEGQAEALTLTSETEAEAQAKAEREAKALADERKKREQEQARLAKEASDRETKARADATVDDFQLGQSADRQLSGQNDMFGESADSATPIAERKDKAQKTQGPDALQQTFREWALASLNSSEYKDAFLEAADGVLEDAAIMAATGNTDIRALTEIMDSAQNVYWRKIIDSPRDASLSLNVYDSLTAGQKYDAQRHFFDLDERIASRMNDKAMKQRQAREEKARPYEDKLNEVNAELARLDKKAGPKTALQDALIQRAGRLEEAIAIARSGGTPDGRLVRVSEKNDDPQPASSIKSEDTAATDSDSEDIRKAKADLIAGIGELASLLSKPGRMNIVPDDEKKLLPILTGVMDAAFRLGHLKFKDAARFVLDKIRELAGAPIADQITLDHLQGAYIGMAGKYRDKGADRPAVVASVENLSDITGEAPPQVRQENNDVPVPDSNLERDRADAGDGEPAMGQAVQGDELAGGASPAGGEVGSAGRGHADDPRLPAGGSAAGRELGDQPVHRADGADKPAEFPARDRDGKRSDHPGVAGVQHEPVAPEAVARVASGQDLARRLNAQRAADATDVVLGDIDNIRATLPYLLPGQQEDVHKAEQRFAKDDGYGILFTNGTGTGKTFTGLGIVKRFARQGKTNTLILVPDAKIMADWVESGKPLGLTITPLSDTGDSGKGITITTYANAGDNDALASRQWDLVVPDEAHSLMQSADAKDTKALDVVRALTLHPRGVSKLHAMLNRADINALSAMHSEIEFSKREASRDDTTEMRRSALLNRVVELEQKAKFLSSELSAKLEALKAKVAASQGAKRPRLAALSATPFAYTETIDWAEGYLFNYEDAGGSNQRGGYNQPNARQQFFMSHFGYRMRYGKLTKPDAQVNSGLMERQFNAWLRKNGSLSGRALDVAADYDRRFVLVDSKVGNEIDRAIKWLDEAAAAERQAKSKDGKEDSPQGMQWLAAEVQDRLYGKDGHLVRRYLLEAIKAKEVIPHIREHMALGRKVVVFHDFKQGGSTNPFQFEERPSRLTDGVPDAEAESKIQGWNEAVKRFNAEFPNLTGSDLLSGLMSPIARFKKEFPGVLLINGDEKPKDLLARYKAFNDDATGPVVALVQSAKNKGWSGHDTTGKHQRVLFNLGLPTQPTMAIQQEGRIYRTGQVSNAIMRYLNTGTNWEKWAFAQTIAGRASTAENLAAGEGARALKDAFIDAFTEADDYRAGHEGEGTGGKAKDAASNNALTEWDRAKSTYWGTAKKNSRTKAQEGTDYFATPEPLGLKLIQWLDVRGGEDVLEPSAGHGAIARWIPDNVNRTAVEPSDELGARLAMVFDGKIIRSDFEGLHVGANKFDGVAMNPPFGTAGRTAVDHVAKAAEHLRNYGRVAAIIPDGPATAAKFDKWFYEEAQRQVKPVAEHPTLGPIYRGDVLETVTSWAKTGTVQSGGNANGYPLLLKVEGKPGASGVTLESVKAIVSRGPRTETYRPAANLYTVAEIKLPGATFERAGTGVRTRVVIFDKLPPGVQQPYSTKHIDLSDAANITELFDRLENLEVPARLKPQQAQQEDAAPAPRQAKAQAQAQKAEATSTGSQAAEGAGMALVEHVTAKGKTLRGVIRKDLSQAQAKAFDAYTFKKDGGWFIRAEHVPAMVAANGGSAKMSRPTPSSITDTPEFRRWFGDSKVVDAEGKPMVVYHGTKADISEFRSAMTADGGFHFGTAAQANMRASGSGKNLTPVYLRAENMQRSKDLGGKWRAKISAAKSAGRDGIVYLNRYEGLGGDVIERLSSEGLLDKLDRMSDADFRRAVPEARDSYIVFRPEQIKSAIGNNGSFDSSNPDITMSRAAQQRTGLPVSEVQQLADAVSANGVKINVVATRDELPSDVLSSVLSVDPEGVARGLLDNKGRVWLIADRLNSRAEALMVALHEGFHRGLRVLGDAKASKMLDQVYRTNAKVRRLADAYQRDYPDLDREAATNEALADLAGAGEAADLNYWAAIKTAVRDFLRRIADAVGIQMDWTDADVAQMVARTARLGLYGGVHVDGDAAMSRGTNDAVPAFDNASGDYNPDLPSFWINQAKKEIDGERMSDAEYHQAVAEYANQRRVEDLLEQLGFSRRGASNVSSSSYYTKNIGIGEIDPEYNAYDEYATYEARVADHEDYHPAGDDVEYRYQINFRGDAAEWSDADIGPDLTNAEALELLKSVLPNEPTASGSSDAAIGGATLSRPSPKHSPEESEALAKAGVRPGLTLKQQAISAWDKAAAMFRSRGVIADYAQQAVLDQFTGIKILSSETLGGLPVDQDPYITARLANGGASSVMRGILLHGQARWAANGQHLEKIDGTKGLLDILKPLGDDLNDWFGWMVGNRAARLKSEGRENNLTDADIKALQGLARTPEQLAKFKQAAVEYAAFKRSVLDVAEGAGLIDPEGRKAWDHADYIPFYREVDGRSTFSPTGRKGFAGQSSGIRVLKGGESALNDPMENLLMNFSRLIDASLKNNALAKTIKVAAPAGVVKKVGYEMSGQLMPKEQIKKVLEEAGTPQAILSVMPDEAFTGMAKIWAIQAPSDPDVVRVMVGGKPQFYKVEDPLLLKAMTSFVPFDFPGLGVARLAKRVLTGAVTATPDFIARNFIRDTMATRMITRDGVKIGSALNGIAKSFQERGAYEAMLFAGASFQSGNVSAGNIEGTAKEVRRSLRRAGMSAASPGGLSAIVIDSPARAWEMYRHASESVENANREAVYEAAMSSGKGATAAAYEAKDLMDFSLRGGSALYQVAADVLPFFNARVQGLYRLGRSDPRRLATYGLIVSTISALLAMANAGRDEYEALEDWKKDTYWHLFIGGRHFMIPKPFELGAAFGTIPERIVRATMGKDTGKKFVQRLGATVHDQLAVDFVPQIIRPGLNVYANWDNFRDRPIETEGDQNKLPSERFGSRTSDTARVIAQAMPGVSDAIGLSPKRLEYLIGGYLGTTGLYALAGADMLVRVAEDKPKTPKWRMDDIPVVKSFYAVDPARATVFESDLYAMREVIEDAYRTARQQEKDGNEARAAMTRKRFEKELAAREAVKDATDEFAHIRKEMDAIYADSSLSPERKRQLLDEMQRIKNKVAESAWKTPEVKAVR